jgi:hypothetical protein
MPFASETHALDEAVTPAEQTRLRHAPGKLWPFLCEVIKLWALRLSILAVD